MTDSVAADCGKGRTVPAVFMSAIALQPPIRPRRKSRALKRGLIVVMAVLWTIGCLIALTLAFSAVRNQCICPDCVGTAP